jgi:hypothetical protein
MFSAALPVNLEALVKVADQGEGAEMARETQHIYDSSGI